jgi:predicted transglutaminase-like cysteine proteinase
MGKYFRRYFGVAAACAFGLALSACSTTPDASSALPLGLPTAAPAGYVDLCRTEPAQCPAVQAQAGVIQAAYDVPQPDASLTPAHWAVLNAVNAQVNQTVRYVTDEEQFGRPDVWVPAVTEGDCEDFALRKRELLWAAGWAPGDLSLALVESPQTGPHAVLIANTAQGAYVLDNANSWVLPWSETNYTWVTAQDASGQWRVAGKNAQALLLAAAMGNRQTTRQVAALDAGTSTAPAGGSSGQIPDIRTLEPGSR